MTSISSGPTPALGHRMLRGVMAGDGRDRPVLVMHVEPRLGAAADDAADQHQRLLHVAGALGRGHDDRGRIVGLDAAIEQMQRLADEAARQHVVDRKALFVIGLRVVRGVMAVRDLDRGDLLGLGAVIVHVAHKGRGEALPGALPAIGAVVQHVAADRVPPSARRCRRCGPANSRSSSGRSPPSCSSRPRSGRWRYRPTPRSTTRRRPHPCRN